MEILDRSRRAAGDADHSNALERAGVGQVTVAFDLDRRCTGDPAQPRQLLGVGAGSAADDHHQVDLAGGLERVLLPPDRHRADGVDDLELVAAADHEGGQLLELPWRLRALRDECHLLASGDGLPVLLLVDHDCVGCKPEETDHLRVAGGSEQDDRVTLVDELDDLLLLLDHPGACTVDDFEAACVCTFHDIGSHPVGSDDDCSAVVDVVERVHGLDAEQLELGDHTLVVDDLPQRVRGLAGGRRLLGLVDCLAHAITESGPLCDADLFDGSHVNAIIPWAGRRPPCGETGGARRCGP